MLLVLSVDGLSAGALGCYGNDWVGTPAIDALAADGVVFDFAISDTPSLDALRSFWSGSSAQCRKQTPDANDVAATLPGMYEAANGHSLLFTDDRSILDLPEAAAFGDQVSVAMPDASRLMDAAGETHLATFFANAAELVSSFAEQTGDRPSIVWLHTSSLSQLWDAPIDYRNRYRDEDDPPPPGIAAVPHRSFSTGDAPDPDELLGLRQAYAGQVALLDEMLETLVGYLQQTGVWQQCAFVLTSPRGFGLGQHGSIGFPEPFATLHEEYLHIPFLFRMPESADQARLMAVHEPTLFQPADFLPTVCEFFSMKNDDAIKQRDGTSAAGINEQAHSTGRQLAFAVSPTDSQCYALRSAAWHLICNEHNGEHVELLFAKPDDRWEMNNVADRCPEIAEKLQTHVQPFLAGDAQACRTELDSSLTAPHV